MTRTRLGESRDPVCGALVPRDSHSWTHRHIKYSFCSEHCRNRFQRWPHLYVGEATFGLAEKQLGTSVPKSHRIRLTRPPTPDQRETLTRSVLALKGIEEIQIEGDQVTVHYDLIQVSLSDIENAIVSACGGLRDGIPDKVERAFIHYSEECELDNLSHLAAHYRP